MEIIFVLRNILRGMTPSAPPAKPTDVVVDYPLMQRWWRLKTKENKNQVRIAMCQSCLQSCGICSDVAEDAIIWRPDKSGTVQNAGVWWQDNWSWGISGSLLLHHWTFLVVKWTVHLNHFQPYQLWACACVLCTIAPLGCKWWCQFCHLLT